MDASDPIRPSKNSCATGAVHIWVPVRPNDIYLRSTAIVRFANVNRSAMTDTK